jgi:hypothetical protein
VTLPATRKWTLLWVASACAGCGGINFDNEPADQRVPVYNGVFKDSNVVGLDYRSGGQTGVTDAAGAYRCETDQTITFSIGGIALGSTPCATLAHPPSLTATGRFDDPQALNIARLLLTLDQDGDPGNGIVISPGLRQVASTWAPIDFAAADFGRELTQIVADVFSVDGRVIDEPPSAASAFEHMEPNLACAYSGVFVGDLPATDSRDVGKVAVRIHRDPATGADVFTFVAFRLPPYALFLKISGSVYLKTRPTLESDRATPEVPSASGAFATPDSIIGEWRNPLQSEPINSAGRFAIARIGTASGTYRFVGSFEDTTGFGVFVLAVDGNEIHGDGHEIVSQRDLKIDGTIASDDSVFLTVGGLGTASGVLARGPSGEAQAIGGTWVDGDRGTFSSYGCRLN